MTGMAPKPSSIMWPRARRRFCWRWDFVQTGAAFFLKRRPTSCDWNIDSARFVFHLVGGLALLARCKTCCLTFSHGRSTKCSAEECSFCSWASPPASCDACIPVLSLCCPSVHLIYLVIIGAVVGYTAYVWLLRHCEPAQSRHLCVRESDRRGPIGHSFCQEKL